MMYFCSVAHLQEKGFFYPSPLNALFNSVIPPVINSLDCFSPCFPPTMITDMIALAILHVRCIECLMDQQQELLRRYAPLGKAGGTEVTCKQVSCNLLLSSVYIGFLGLLYRH